MFTVVATVLQQNLSAQWGRVRRRQNNGHHKNCIKTREADWWLEFIGGKYDCAGESQQQL
jgi:hypothetical protein